MNLLESKIEIMTEKQLNILKEKIYEFIESQEDLIDKELTVIINLDKMAIYINTKKNLI